MKKFLTVLMSLSLFSVNSGCEDHHYHEPGVAHYSMGEFYSVEKIAIEQAWTGSLKAMETLGYAVTKREKDALTALIVARGSNDRRVEINLEKQSEGLTEIRILVGEFGNETLSKLILDEIKKQS